MSAAEYRLAKAALNQLRTQRLAEGGYTQNMPDKVAWETLQSDLFANLPQIKAERMPQDFSVVLPKLWRKRQAWDAERTKRPPYRGEER